MTITEKANSSELPVEEVVAIAVAAGIDAEDLNRKLTPPEAMKLGTAVKKSLESSDENKGEPDMVRFWSRATRHIIALEGESIKLEDNVIVLDPEKDKDTVEKIRSLRNILGRYSIYEVINEPLEEDSSELEAFQVLLEEIIFTGDNREVSMAGIKTVRAMFSPKDLEAMAGNGFNPRRLVMKVLNSKSLKLVSNNV